MFLQLWQTIVGLRAMAGEEKLEEEVIVKIWLLKRPCN
jgi:hypothetical protein